MIVSDRRADAVTISKERPENQPTHTADNHIGSVQENKKDESISSTQFNKALEALSMSFVTC